MDDLIAYVLFAGVVLMWVVLAYAGYTNLLSRLRKRIKPDPWKKGLAPLN